MAKFLLDYFFKITTITPTPAASTAFLKQACLVVAPKAGQEANVGEIYECVTMTEVGVRTDNVDAQQLFNAGMSKVYILLADDLYLEEFLEDQDTEFYTLLVSSDFDEDDFKQVDASGTITITSYANLVSGVDDIITVAGVAFTAQAAAVVEGETTFQAATSNDATAASLAAQINAHEAVSLLVEATVVGAIVTLTALAENKYEGNDVTLTYTDGDAAVGATLAGLVGGKLSGGAGLFAGSFAGVIGVWSSDATELALQAAMSNRCGFYGSNSNKAKNMCFAFGSMLSNALSWKNQQYIDMPYDDGISVLGTADSYFADAISFVLNDEQYGMKLGMFACGGKAITAPYIIKNLNIDTQSKALQYVSANQPDYTLTEASLIEDECQKVIDLYVSRKLLTSGKIEIKLEQDNFVASAYMTVPTPKALWRFVGQLTQTT